MKSRWVLAALGVAMAAVLFLSDRPWGLTSMPRVAEVAVLPDTPEFRDVRRYTEIGAAILPYMPAEEQVPREARPSLKVGVVYREIVALRMPVWASGNLGFVTYLETPEGIRIAGLSPSQIEMIEQRTGNRFS